MERGLGDRLKTFAEARKVYDPKDRLLNAYFRAAATEGCRAPDGVPARGLEARVLQLEVHVAVLLPQLGPRDEDR